MARRQSASKAGSLQSNEDDLKIASNRHGGVIATLEIAFLNSQLQERKRRLEEAIALAPQRAGF
jgi:hypothetical protein